MNKNKNISQADIANILAQYSDTDSVLSAYEALSKSRKAHRSDPRTPAFTIPEKLNEQYENLQKWLTARANGEKCKIEGKQFHWFQRRILGRIHENNFNPLTQTVALKALAKRKKGVHKARRKLAKEAIPALIMMADHVTGYLPYSCITSLSDQLDITTYGQALYLAGEKVEKGQLNEQEAEQAKTKPSVKRASLFIHFLEELSFIEIEHIQDPITKEELPAIVRLTDNFYVACGETIESLASFRNQHLNWMKINNQLNVDPGDYEDTIEFVKAKKLKSIIANRETYRSKLRKRRELNNMSPEDIKFYGARLAASKYSQAELDNMTEKQFEAAIKFELNNLFSFANSPPDKVH